MFDPYYLPLIKFYSLHAIDIAVNRWGEELILSRAAQYSLKACDLYAYGLSHVITDQYIGQWQQRPQDIDSDKEVLQMTILFTWNLQSRLETVVYIQRHLYALGST